MTRMRGGCGVTRRSCAGGSARGARRSHARACGRRAGATSCGVAASGRMPSSRMRRCRRHTFGAMPAVASSTGANDHIASERSPTVRSSRTTPCSRARSTSCSSSGKISRRRSAMPGPPPWRRKRPRNGRLRACRPSTCSRNETRPIPRVLGGRGRLGRGDHLLDVLGEDLLGEGLAGREVAIERADPHAGAAGDLLERGVGALLGEDLAPGGGQLGAVPGGIAAQLRHVLKVAEPEAASVCGVRAPRNRLAGPRVPTADERRSHAAHHPCGDRPRAPGDARPRRLRRRRRLLGTGVSLSPALRGAAGSRVRLKPDPRTSRARWRPRRGRPRAAAPRRGGATARRSRRRPPRTPWRRRRPAGIRP